MQSGNAPPLDPDLFSHGRLLRRFPGSDASRFSARTALHLLQHIEVGAGPQVLWDPFCGSGMIPCVTLLAMALDWGVPKFSAVIASDVDATAARCARDNMRLFCQGDAFDRRLAEVRAEGYGNPGRVRSWERVARYMETLRPFLPLERAPACHAFAASVFALPPMYSQLEESQVHIVGDAPYGSMSSLHGGGLPAALAALRRDFPGAGITLVARRDVLPAVEHLPGLRWRGLKGKRAILHL